MGHEWESSPRSIGNVNSILLDSEQGLYFGAADSTREGSAIGLSSKEPSIDEMISIVEQLEDDGEIENSGVARLFKTHLTAVGHYESQQVIEKAIKHMKSFQSLIEHQRDNELISVQVYDTLYSYAESLLDHWK